MTTEEKIKQYEAAKAQAETPFEKALIQLAIDRLKQKQEAQKEAAK